MLANIDDWSYIVVMSRANKSDTTRQILLDIGLRLFSVRGYHGTGIKEIVDAANVPKGSFYNYFKSKEDFGIEIIREHSKKFWQIWNEVFDTNDADPLNALCNCFEIMIESYSECSISSFSAVSLIASEICQSSDVCRNAMLSIIDEMSSRLAEQLNKAQIIGVARSDIDSNEMASLFWDAWMGTLVHMKIINSHEPARLCAHLFLNKIFRR
jgi:TetR/AcrR family transcriptional regulator, transcriptional repressor for nem operon